MLGYICISRDAPGKADAADRLLAGLAARLAAEGVPLAGAVQVNRGAGAGCAAEMRLRLLPGGEERVISQRLGSAARGCRLDGGALEQAVARMEAGLDGARLVILNKFGKQEATGRGVRPLIAEALSRGLPVLLAVSPEVLPGFLDFAGGLAEPLAPEAAEAWARAAAA